MTIQEEREAARKIATHKRRVRRWVGAGIGVLVVALVGGGIILYAHPGGSPKPTPTPTVTPTPSVSPTPFPLPPTASAVPGSQISVSIDGVVHPGNGNAGTYKWTAPFGNQAVTLIFTGSIPGDQGLPLNICDDLIVYLPPPYSAPPAPTGPQPPFSPGAYGLGPYLSINSDNQQVAGTKVVIPVDPDFRSHPIGNAQWSLDYHFC